MATRQNLRVPEGNDAVMRLTIRPTVSGDDLDVISVLRLYIKPDVCAEDTDPGVVVLSTADPAQIVIDSRTSAQILATAYLPRLAGSYTRSWRVDGVATLGTRRTAIYGLIEVEPV